MLKRIIRRLDTEINYAFFRRYRYARTVRRHLAAYYTDSQPESTNEHKMIIYMADGLIHHSGFADRIRGILTLYDYCKKHGLDFRINFTDPFPLEKFLIPADYDWRIRDWEISRNKKSSIPVYVDKRRDEGEREKQWQEATFDYYFNKCFKQAHVYTNFDYAEERYASLFYELFRMSPVLKQKFEEASSKLGKSYISVSTRFLELLGDFKEPKPMVKPLSKVEGDALIDLCLSKIEKIHKSECQDGEKILVTSDSVRFLDAACQLDFVEIIDGKVAHISVKDSDREDADLKTMVDFIAISRARKSFLLQTGDMYLSNFSKRAAQIGGQEFVEVKF